MEKTLKIKAKDGKWIEGIPRGSFDYRDHFNMDTFPEWVESIKNLK